VCVLYELHAIKTLIIIIIIIIIIITGEFVKKALHNPD